MLPGLTATKTDGSTISVSYDENVSTSSRTASIRASGTGGVEETVTVTQEGAAIIFDVSPNSRNVGSASGTTSFAVNSNVGWSVEDDASWLTATKTDGSTISVSYDENVSTSSRTASIKASGTGGVEETVTVTQEGAAIIFDVSPNSRNVGSASGTTSFAVNSNVGWSVEDDASWLTATKTDGSTISVSYDENVSTSSRTASIRASGTGGVEETVMVTQEGKASFDVSPNSRIVSWESGTTSFIVSTIVEWSVEDDASWLTATKTDVSTITVSYDTNKSASSRIASIRAYGSGGVEETVTVEQNGTIPNAMVDLLDNKPIAIYPNPSINSVYLKVSTEINSGIFISLYDGSGILIYSRFVDKLLPNEPLEIDISACNHGVYILRLNTANSFVIKKIIKQ